MDFKIYKELKRQVQCNFYQNDVITRTYIGGLDYVIMTENVDFYISVQAI